MLLTYRKWFYVLFALIITGISIFYLPIFEVEYQESYTVDVPYYVEEPYSEEVTYYEVLHKGWNEFIYLADDCDYDSYAEVTCTSEIGETHSSGQVYFSYNSETGYDEIEPLNWIYENKPLHDDWNWESFPKLPVNSNEMNGEQNISSLLYTQIYPDNYTSGNLKTLYQQINNYGNLWYPTNYPIRSSDGTKLQVNGVSDYYYVANGTRFEGEPAF